jgi:hypothetical protein
LGTNLSNMPPRYDPVGSQHFQAVDIAEMSTQILFYIVALLSFAVLLVNKNPDSPLFQIVHISFILTVVALFTVSLALRLYWSPIAADARCLDLLSNAYSLPLTHDQSVNYYNNNETDPIRRLGAAVMENSFFSKSISSAMLPYERLKLACYVILLGIVWLNRTNSFDLVELAAQVVFSESILSYWLRLEWFRSRCDKSYNGLYTLFQNQPRRQNLHAQVLQWVIFYETTK